MLAESEALIQTGNVTVVLRLTTAAEQKTFAVYCSVFWVPFGTEKNQFNLKPLTSSPILIYSIDITAQKWLRKVINFFDCTIAVSFNKLFFLILLSRHFSWKFVKKTKKKEQQLSIKLYIFWFFISVFTVFFFRNKWSN